MDLVIPIICIIIWLILLVQRIKSFNALNKEDKDTYYGAKDKIQDIKKKKKIFNIIAIVLYIIIFVGIILMEHFEIGRSHRGLGTIDMYRDPLKVLYNYLLVILRIYLVAYFIAHIIFEYVCVKKNINKSEILSEKEKSLLNVYYIKPAIMYVLTCIVILIIIAVLLYIPSMFYEI